MHTVLQNLVKKPAHTLCYQSFVALVYVTFVSILGFGYGGIPFMLAIIIVFVPILMCC